MYLITRQDNSVNRGSRQRATKREQENEIKMGKEIGKRKRQSKRERDSVCYNTMLKSKTTCRAFVDAGMAGNSNPALCLG